MILIEKATKMQPIKLHLYRFIRIFLIGFANKKQNKTNRGNKNN